MKIDRLVLGAYETNCYVARVNEAAKNCLIIDAGLEADKLIDFLKTYELNPVALVLTHGHIDHIAGVAELRRNFHDIKVYIHKLDAVMLTEAKSNLSAMMGIAFATEPADFILEQQSTVEQAGLKLLVLHTPGHSPGGISLHSPAPASSDASRGGGKEQGIVFVGDTLFAGSIGRTDFPGGNMTQLLDSIKEKLLTLPDETKVYPGHGPLTTIADEKAHNPFFT